MLEEERKYEVDAAFRLPDLTDCVPEDGRLIARPPQKLRATYYDTTDLRLARSGASLRYRRGDDEPWTVKLPTDAPGVRNEISMPGPPSAVPDRLLELALSYTRGAPVSPVVTLNTVRRAYQLCDREDRVAVEVVDDTVSVADGRRVALKFREIEVERKAGKAKLLDVVEAALRDAGAATGRLHPQTRPGPGAGGDRATRLAGAAGPPAQASHGRRRGPVRAATRHRPHRHPRPPGPAARRGGRRRHRGAPDAGGCAAGCAATCARSRRCWRASGPRRCAASSDGSPARSAPPATPRCCGRGCAGPRPTDALAPLDEVSVARIDADLTARHEDALHALDKEMSTERYHRAAGRAAGRGDRAAPRAAGRRAGRPGAAESGRPAVAAVRVRRQR